MEQIQSDDMEDESSNQPNSSFSAYQHGINGEPVVIPRVGDQYQAEIPLLLPQYYHLGSEENLTTFDLPIPLMWTKSEKFRGFREAETEKGSLEPSAKRKSYVLALPCQRTEKFKFEWLDDSLYPFPGTLGESWQDAEQLRFLLGLYCLGKNLVLVQRFVGSKKMGDLLSYYYGSFYGSNEYRRWLDGHKTSSKRSVQGRKLFTGWRQQELLSRITSHVSEECKKTLLKVSKAFREDKMALEEYVFTLKNTVGIDTFIEAIGIGKGKKDLTNSSLEPSKLKHGASGNSRVRICNDLPMVDIVKFLTGEYRMSKTKASDLFWEAVWPRLLARGWHSEQPKDGPRNSLVFLIPEATKFSRRKMSKGNQYFDSITDVLNKVALDPTLLHLNTDEDQEKKETKDEEIKNTLPINLESPKIKKKKKYLQPRSKPSKSKEVMMFRIVDTSAAECNLEELRSLPVETCGSIADSPRYLNESENKAETTAKSMASRTSSAKSGSVNMDSGVSRSSISVKEKRHKNRKGAKRGSLADCTLIESGCFGETQHRKKKKKPVKKKETQVRPNPSEEHVDEDQTLKLSTTSSFAGDSHCGRNEDREKSPERPETREAFDLNVSQTSLEREVEGTYTDITDVVQNSESSCAEVETLCKPQEVQQVTADLPTGRRQSTRTRPLTTKALEAFAFGYLGDSKQKRKASEESRPKSTKRIRRTSRVSSEFRNGIVEDGSNTDEKE